MSTRKRKLQENENENENEAGNENETDQKKNRLPDKKDCLICYDELGDNVENIKQLNEIILQNGTSICGHEFHKNCINRWMNSSNGNSHKCPVCLTDISEDQWPQNEPFITILICSGNTKLYEVLNIQLGLVEQNTINDVLNIVNAMKEQILQQIINNQNLFRRGLQHIGICSRPNDIRFNSITPTIPGRCTGIPGFNHFNYTNLDVKLIDAYNDGLTICKTYLRREANPLTQNYISVKNAIKKYINSNGIEEDYYLNPELIPKIPLEFRPTGSEIVTSGLIPPQLANIPYDENGSIRISSVTYASKVPVLCLKIDISGVCNNSGGKKSRKSKKKSKKFRKKSRKKSRK